MPKTQHHKTDMTKDVILVMSCAALMIAGGLLARAVKPEAKTPDEMADVTTTPIGKHEAIKAEIIDRDPSHFMIDVEKLANLGADENAETFAVYVSNDKPKTCGDFTALKLPYKKPEEHKRQFDLSDHPEVIEAIDHYGCVVMRNIPPTAAAS